MGSPNANHYIELNGKRYNALTGEVVAAVKPAAKPTHSVSHGKTIDGFVRTSASRPAATPAVKKPALATTKPLAQPVKAGRSISDIQNIHRGPAKPAPRRPQEHSKTLMRKAVKKPAPSLKRTLKSHTRTDVLAKTPDHTIVPKHSIATIDERRLKHARQVAKSQLISRFGHVQLTPGARPIATHTPTAAVIKETIQSTPRAEIKPVYASSAAAPAMKAQPSLDIFEQALARANSHKQTYIAPKKKLKHRTKKRSARSKFITTGATALAVLLIGGFIAYQNTANIEMRIAASKAGIHASLPSYKPVGFSPASFMYDNGAVAVDFRNNSDGRVYKVIQKSSNWDSDALANEYVASVAGASYHTVQTGGRTIYTYGNNNATWVDSGIWYNVTANGALNKDQLLDLARSM